MDLPSSVDIVWVGLDIFYGGLECFLMALPPRSKVTSPIQEFVYIPSNDTLDAVNDLVIDINRYLSFFALGIPLNSSTVANLPASAPEGTKWWALDGRKVGEGSGAGSGVEVYWSNGAWRVTSTDAPVSASGAMGSMFNNAAFSELLVPAGLAQ